MYNPLARLIARSTPEKKTSRPCISSLRIRGNGGVIPCPLGSIASKVSEEISHHLYITSHIMLLIGLPSAAVVSKTATPWRPQCLQSACSRCASRLLGMTPQVFVTFVDARSLMTWNRNDP